MADLGSIGTLSCSPKASIDKGPRQTLRKLVAGPLEYVIGGKDTVVGYPTAPSLRIDTFGKRRFRWTVSAGTRTISVRAKQVINTSPRPRMTVLANPAIGVMANVDGSAPSGTGWELIGPLTITPSSGGTVWVELENLQLGQFVPVYFDDIQTPP